MGTRVVFAVNSVVEGTFVVGASVERACGASEEAFTEAELGVTVVGGWFTEEEGEFEWADVVAIGKFETVSEVISVGDGSFVWLGDCLSLRVRVRLPSVEGV